MDSLKDIEDYPFDGYDPNAIQSTKENIANLQVDLDKVWEIWASDGLHVDEEFVIDFDFYSSDKEGVKYFSTLLENNNFAINVKGTSINCLLERK